MFGLWNGGWWELYCPFAGWGWDGFVYVWGRCSGIKGVSLWVRCSMLVMVSNGRFMFVRMIW